MSRREFSTATRKAALKRSGGVCEAVGDWYGLPAGKRCCNRLSYGVEYDHLILVANSGDASLENCRAVCIPCHRHKTTTLDIPTAAKTRAQSVMGMKARPKQKIASRPKAPKPKRDRPPMLPRRNPYNGQEIR